MEEMEEMEISEEKDSIKSSEIKAEASLSEVSKGVFLFMIALIAFAFYGLGTKITMRAFNLNVPELMYYTAVILIGPFYWVVRSYKKDVLGVHSKDVENLVKRIICGFLADSLLFAAMNTTSYSRAFCLFFTNTLMSPFIASRMLGQPIKKWDIVGIIIGFLGMLMIVQPFDTSK
jgi:drug/metabolite transporter (DMT)-like permease